MALYVGAAAPVQTVFDVSSSGAPFDLSTVDSAVLLVAFANGVTASWPVTVEAQPGDDDPTPTRCRLVRVHDAADVPEGAEGTARIRADILLTGVAEPIRTRWRAFEVLSDET